MIQLAPIIARLLASRVAPAAAGALSRGGLARVIGSVAALKPGEIDFDAGVAGKKFKGLAARSLGEMLSRTHPPAGNQEQSEQRDAQQHEAASLAMKGFIGGVIGMAVAGKKMADTLTEAHSGLARFNGQIGLAYARLNRGEFLRSRASAIATAGSTEILVNSVNGMRDELRPIKDATTTGLNLLAAGVAKLISYAALIIKTIPHVAAALAILEKIEEHNRKNRGMGPFQQHLNDLAREAREAREKNRKKGGRN